MNGIGAFVAWAVVIVGCQGGMVVGGGAPRDGGEDAGRGTPAELDAAVASADDAAVGVEDDAGSAADARPIELDAEVGARPACPPGLLFCDDFESGDLEPRWSPEIRFGVLAGASDARAFEGARALRIELPAADAARGYLAPRDLLPVAGNRIWGRFYLLVPSSVGMVHSALVEARGRIDGNRTTYGLHSNSSRLNSRYRSPVIEEHGGLKKFGEHRLPSEWTCIELLYDGDANEMRYWFDGVEDEGMHVQPSTDPEWIAPTFEQIVVGFLTYQAADAPFEVWYDAVAFDDERIGCM